MIEVCDDGFPDRPRYGPGKALLMNFAGVGLMSMMQPPGLSNARATPIDSVPAVSNTTSNRFAIFVASKSKSTIG